MFTKRPDIDGQGRTHRVLAVRVPISIPAAAYFSSTGDPLAPHPLVYVPLFPLALLTVAGTWMLVPPWIKSSGSRPPSATTDNGQ